MNSQIKYVITAGLIGDKIETSAVSYDDAVIFAKSLARNKPGRVFFILQVVGMVRADVSEPVVERFP